MCDYDEAFILEAKKGEPRKADVFSGEFKLGACDVQKRFLRWFSENVEVCS